MTCNDLPSFTRSRLLPRLSFQFFEFQLLDLEGVSEMNASECTQEFDIFDVRVFLA